MLHQYSDIALLALRIGVAVSFLVHGFQKLNTWWKTPIGGGGVPAGMHRILRLLSIVEPLGGIALIAGFLTQAAALGFVIIMLGAIQLKAMKMHKKFAETGGWELDLTLLTPSFALLILGAGKISLDYLLFGM
jgi:putative oxidoreductase